MGAPAKRVELTPEDLATLLLWETSGKTEQRLATRARVVLAAVEGLSLKAIAERTGLGYNSCLKWRKRFQAVGLDGLKDAPGRGRHESISQEQRLEVMALACTTPVDGSNAWSIRKLAYITGLGVGTIHRILNAGDLKPHTVLYFPNSEATPGNFAIRNSGGRTHQLLPDAEVDRTTTTVILSRPPAARA